MIDRSDRRWRRALVSWSGGKDSCLAAHLAVEAGCTLDELVCVVEPDADRSRSHALPAWLLQAQAAALGARLTLPRAGWTDYESVFIDTLRRSHAHGVTEAIFGDIDLAPHREWEERVCAAAGLAPLLPLWDWSRVRVIEEILTRDIEAICVCVNTSRLPADFCGRTYDRRFLADLPPTVDACGENGEFHTCVVRAPLFASRIPARVAGFHDYRAPPEHGGDVFRFADLAPA